MPHSRPLARADVPDRGPARWRLGILVGLVVLLVGGWFLFGRSLETRHWIGRLGGEGDRQARERLVQSNWGGADDVLADAMRDEDRPFVQRVGAAQILLDRQRHPRVEAALKDERVAVRAVAIAALRGRDWFQNYLARPDLWPIRPTLEAWIGREGDPSRAAGIEIVQQHGMKEMAPLLLPLVTRSDASGAADPPTLVAAAQALASFAVCEVVAPLATMAREDPDDNVRRTALGLLYRLVRAPQPACREHMTEEALREIVVAGIDGEVLTRHTALLYIRQEPEWVRGLEDRLHGILERDVRASVRREALAGLAVARSPRLLQELARWLHDPEMEVRSEAVSATRTVTDGAERATWAACWIGILENETESRLAMIESLNGLREIAGRWIGLPPELSTPELSRQPEQFRPTMEQFTTELWHRGEALGLARKDWAERWWRWWAARLELQEGEIEEAWSARRSFWDAARRGDATAARAALQGERWPRDLFCYEQGWLQAH